MLRKKGLIAVACVLTGKHAAGKDARTLVEKLFLQRLCYRRRPPLQIVND